MTATDEEQPWKNIYVVSVMSLEKAYNVWIVV